MRPRKGTKEAFDCYFTQGKAAWRHFPVFGRIGILRILKFYKSFKSIKEIDNSRKMDINEASFMCKG